MPKPTIGELGLIPFEACIDGSAVLQTLSELRTGYVVKGAHIEGIGRLVMDGVSTVYVSQTVHKSPHDLYTPADNPTIQERFFLVFLLIIGKARH